MSSLRRHYTDLRVILGYPVLRFFDPEIWWRERIMFIRKGPVKYEIPIQLKPLPHSVLAPPVSVDAPRNFLKPLQPSILRPLVW